MQIFQNKETRSYAATENLVEKQDDMTSGVEVAVKGDISNEAAAELLRKVAEYLEERVMLCDDADSLCDTNVIGA